MTIRELQQELTTLINEGQGDRVVTTYLNEGRHGHLLDSVTIRNFTNAEFVLDFGPRRDEGDDRCHGELIRAKAAGTYTGSY